MGRSLCHLLLAGLLIAGVGQAQSPKGGTPPKGGEPPGSSPKGEAPPKAGEKSAEPKAATTYNPAQWVVRTPEIARDKKAWRALINAMVEHGLDYGAMAAARRMLVHFDDVDSKEFAYRSIIELADRVWPFSVRSYFIPGDLDGKGSDDWIMSYNLYKAVLNEDAGMARWAAGYYANVNKEEFLKYSFHLAVKAYADGEHEKAMELLRGILRTETAGEQNQYLLTKAARTLARILYEKESYEDSLEIYESFLLKLNPVVPEDFLEAAWNLFRLKRYSRALGYLYNLESPKSGRQSNTERYVLRAAIYRDNCEADRMANLSETFDFDYGDALKAIRNGRDLSKIDILHRVALPENADYTEHYLTKRGLTEEKEKIEILPEGLHKLATHLFKTEIDAQRDFLNLYETQSLEASAEYLVNTSEALKFMAFDVAREKFDPSAVFAEPAKERDQISEVSRLPPGKKEIWRQFHDFWRDERMDFLVGIRNRCAE